MKARRIATLLALTLTTGCATANREIGLDRLAPESPKESSVIKAEPLVVWVYNPKSDLTTAELSKIMVLFFRWQNMKGNIDFEKELNKSEAEPGGSIVRHFQKQAPEKKSEAQ
jgi:hypothetical protein